MILLEGKLFQLVLRHLEQEQNNIIVLKCTAGEVVGVLSAFNEQTATPAQRLDELHDIMLSDLDWLPLLESRQGLTCRHPDIEPCNRCAALVEADCPIAQPLLRQ